MQTWFFAIIHLSCLGNAGDGVNNRDQWGENTEMNTSTLIWGVLFGSIGLGFFVYGKKQKVIIPLLSGIGLMVLPYIISNLLLLILCGVILIGLPFLVKI